MERPRDESQRPAYHSIALGIRRNNDAGGGDGLNAVENMVVGGLECRLGIGEIGGDGREGDEICLAERRRRGGNRLDFSAGHIPIQCADIIIKRLGLLVQGAGRHAQTKRRCGRLQTLVEGDSGDGKRVFKNQ